MKLKVQKTTELTNIDSFCIEHAEINSFGTIIRTCD